jgi:hypothetical protein
MKKGKEESWGGFPCQGMFNKGTGRRWKLILYIV